MERRTAGVGAEPLPVTDRLEAPSAVLAGPLGQLKFHGFRISRVQFGDNLPPLASRKLPGGFTDGLEEIGPQSWKDIHWASNGLGLLADPVDAFFYA